MCRENEMKFKNKRIIKLVKFLKYLSIHTSRLVTLRLNIIKEWERSRGMYEENENEGHMES